MRIKKKFAFIFSVLILVTLISCILAYSQYASAMAEKDPDARPLQCKVGSSCTAGDSCCWTTTGSGATQATCGNDGKWGGAIDCPSFQSCNGNGAGHKCVNNKKTSNTAEEQNALA